MIDKESEKKLRKLAEEPCEPYTNGSCLDNPAKSADAPYLADRYCSTCLIRNALNSNPAVSDDHNITEENILDLKVDPDYTQTPIAIKEYFQKIMFLLWEEPESFTGKRPFGNSGWDSSIIFEVEEQTGLTETEAKILISKALSNLFE